jgi:hypothetical protein
MAGTYPFYIDEWAYVRHRSRMVRQSIYEDAKHVLSVPRDYAGRLEDDPNVALNQLAQPDVYSWLNADPDMTMPLLGQFPLEFIEYFPEEGLEAYEKISLNTLALDNGAAEPEYEYELGGMFAQEWTFTFAINSSTDAVAQALFQDLNDRYIGRASIPASQELIDNLESGDSVPGPMNADRITLYNYAATPPIPITRMEVESFQFAKSAEQVAPGVQLFFAELVVTDFLPQGGS